jgi:eukaryotic-like serine/threonine-protein kinase
MLGAARAGQKRFDEAEPLLLEGYHGMQDRAGSMPPFHLPRIGEAVQRIIDFYTDVGRASDVAKWQAVFNGLNPEAKRSLLTR